jgi:hypothetical protein
MTRCPIEPHGVYPSEDIGRRAAIDPVAGGTAAEAPRDARFASPRPRRSVLVFGEGKQRAGLILAEGSAHGL